MIYLKCILNYANNYTPTVTVMISGITPLTICYIFQYYNLSIVPSFIYSEIPEQEFYWVFRNIVVNRDT